MPVPEGVRASAGVAFYTLVLVGIGEVIALPLTWYIAFVLERRYGLSRHLRGDWLRGFAKVTAVRLVAWTMTAVIVYVAARAWPTTWWLVIGVVFGMTSIAVTHLAPVVVLPWLYDLRPLRRPALRARLEQLVRRVGAPAMRMFEWRLGQEAPRANAALVGVGVTRRVLLTDALLADFSEDEIEVVVAHEIAHHVHKDVWQTAAYEAVAATLACYVGHVCLYRLGPWLRIDGVADVAGLPLLVLGAGGVVLLLAPVTNLISRRHERRADLYALKVTGKPDALVSGLRRLATQSLAEERPSRVVESLFHTHPPVSDRLTSAHAAAVTPVRQTEGDLAV